MTCGTCDGLGWVVTPDGGAGRAARCACQVPPIEDRMRRAGVPEALVTPREWQGRRHEDLALFPDPGHFLTLTGATGRGKSRQAADLVRVHLAGGGLAKWWEVEELLKALKTRFNCDPGPESVVEPLLSPRILLVLDETWAEQETDFNAAEVSRIIRRRYRDRSPTIVTTNLNEREIEALEPRLHSRMWGSVVIEMGGPDFRRRLAATAAGGSR